MGFVSGCALGLNFHRETWLGGYGSFKRRLYRLGHISFFGLGAVNLMFYFTVRSLGAFEGPIRIASWSFVAGALSMPLVCLIMAHRPKWRALFVIPVGSLMAGGVVTLWEIAKL